MIEYLLALLIAMTGFGWTVSPELTALAEKRVVEHSVNRDGAHPHRNLWELNHWEAWGEVLMWSSSADNNYDAAKVAVDAWRGSPGHYATLTDRKYTHIGCAFHSNAGPAHPNGPRENDAHPVHNWFACILGLPKAQRAAQPAQPPASGGPLLPNTAMGF